MKTVLYFILACLTIAYLGFLCYVNIIGITTISTLLYYITIYGGLGIALLYAAVNFLGSPLKIVFFILLVIMTVLMVLTATMPGAFRSLFKIEDTKDMIEVFLR